MGSARTNHNENGDSTLNRVCSIFSQILALIPRLEFEAAVKKHKAERHARGFSSWAQMIGMLFCQLEHAQSLREITGGLAACEGKLRHLGVVDPPKRTSLSYANEHRPWQLYETVFHNLRRCQAEAKSHKRSFRFKHKLLSLDSTVIPLCLSVFDWAHYKRTKGAVKNYTRLEPLFKTMPMPRPRSLPTSGPAPGHGPIIPEIN